MFIFNVIGYSYSGKSTFISNRLKPRLFQLLGQKVKVFDIKDFYKTNKINPTEYSGARYPVLKELIYNELFSIIEKLEKKEKETNIKQFIIIESSGINLAINEILQYYKYFTIFVWTPVAKIKERLEKISPKFDVMKINRSIYRELKYNTIKFDMIYYSLSDSYYTDYGLKVIIEKDGRIFEIN
jgi:predicted kinase